MRLLLVDDDPAVCRVLAQGLREQSYAIDVATDGTAALQRAGTAAYDAIVLDVMLPALDGLAVCAAIRRRGSLVPILMLTARDGVDARIAGLDSGADGYVTKPFDFGELLARLRALVRRGPRRPPVAERATRGPLTIDTRARRVWVSHREVSLTVKEYALLAYLVLRAGDIVSRAEIVEIAWAETFDPTSNLVDVYVQRVRRKLEGRQKDSLIRARRGEGYQLICHPES